MWRIVLLCLLSLAAYAEDTRCGAREMQVALAPSDPAFPNAQTLQQQLTDAGLRVECVLSSKMAGFFDGQKGAALFRTTSGDFEVLFLPQHESFDRLTILQKHTSDSYLYSFRGAPQFHTTLESPRPISFIQCGNKLFVLWSGGLAEKLNQLSGHHG
jgi:hypothetical protein